MLILPEFWGSEKGRDCSWCELDRIDAVCHGEIRDCEKLKSLKKNLMERVWMKAKRGDNRYPKSNPLIHWQPGIMVQWPSGSQGGEGEIHEMRSLPFRYGSSEVLPSRRSVLGMAVYLLW